MSAYVEVVELAVAQFEDVLVKYFLYCLSLGNDKICPREVLGYG